MWEDEDPGFAESKRRRAGSAPSGWRKLSSGGPVEPGVPFYFNLLPDAVIWPKTGRVGEQRLLLVQYWRQMQREMAKETEVPAGSQEAVVDAAPVADTAIVAEVAPQSESVVPQPAAVASSDAIPLAASTGFPSLEDLEDDGEEAPDIAASAPIPEPQLEPEPAPQPDVVPSANTIFGKRTSWVPASVLFARKPEEEARAESSPTDTAVDAPPPTAQEVAPAAPASLLEPALEAPLLQTNEPPAASADASDDPVMPSVELVASELQRSESIEPMVAEPARDPDLVLPPQAEPAAAVPSVVESTEFEPAAFELAADTSTPAPPVVELAEAPPEAALPDLDLPTSVVAAVPELQADEVFNPVFVEVGDAAPVPAGDVPVFAGDLAIDAVSDATVDLPEARPSRFDAAAVADLLAANAPEPVTELPIAPEADRLGVGTWHADWLVQAQAGEKADQDAAAFTALPSEAPQLDDLRVEGLTATEAADVDMPALVSDQASVPDVANTILADELPEMHAPASAEPCDTIPVDVTATVTQVAETPIVELPEMPVERPLQAEDVDFDALVATEIGQVELDDVMEDASIDVPVPVAEELLVPESDEFAAPAIGDAQAEPTSSADSRQMPAPQADPVWVDAVAHWTIEARDTRLRRASVIPMPSGKPASVATVSRRSALPALERFLRSAQARRRQVAESVA